MGVTHQASMHVWEIAIWIILFFVVFGSILQYLTKRATTYHSAKMRHLIQQNKKLSDNIQELHRQIYSLNMDIGRITAENKILKGSVKELQERVNCLQSNIMRSGNFTPCS